MQTIETADIQLLRDYASYVEGKIDINEIPLDFQQWQDNYSPAYHQQEFEVYCTWKMEAVVKIKAQTEEEALKQAKNIDLPEAALVEDSFEVSIFNPNKD